MHHAEYLTNATREIYIPGIRRCPRASGPASTPRGASKSKEKRRLTRREPDMRLSTKGRYAVMAMADLAGSIEAETPASRVVALADIAARQDISLSYLEQLFAKLRRGGLVTSVRGPGGGYRLCAAIERTAHRRHHPGGGRADRRHPLQDRAAPRAAPRRARAASPMICGKNWVSRSMSSCRRSRWPMWWSSACWAARSPATTRPTTASRAKRPEQRNAMHYLDHNATSPLRAGSPARR